MRAARDSFLRFLADSLTGITVHNLRRDPNVRDSENIKANAVNVQFIGDDLSVHVRDLTVAIDVVHESELSAISMTEQVWSILSPAGYISLSDYTTPTSPQATGYKLFWNPEEVRFSRVYSDMTFRYTCLLTLSYHQ